MFDGLIAFGHSIAHFSAPATIFYALLASLVGVIIGAICDTLAAAHSA